MIKFAPHIIRKVSMRIRKPIQKRLVLVLGFLSFLMEMTLAAQALEKKYYLRTLDISNGLSQNTVNCIFQDKLGFIWLGTKDGLNRYDGYSFTIFKKELGNKNSLGSNFVTDLYEDGHRNLWIGTTDGIFIYDMDNESFRDFGEQTADGQRITYPVNNIIQDKEGFFWISTEGQGVFRYDARRRELLRYLPGGDGQPGNSKVRLLRTDPSGFIWFSLGSRGLFYTKDKMKTILPFEKEPGRNLFEGEVILDMFFGEDQLLYLILPQNGFVSLDLSTGRLTELFGKEKKLFMRKIIQTTPDEFWIGSESGVYIYHKKRTPPTHLFHINDDPYSLSDNAIHSLYKDRDGGIWIGSYFGGVNYYPKQYTYFEKYYPSSQNGLRGKRIREFCEDPSGSIWIGTEDKGLSRFDPKTKKIEPIHEAELYSNIHGLCMDGNELWIGTYSQGLYKLNTVTRKIKRYIQKNAREQEGLSYSPEKNIYVVCKDQSEEIWIGGGSGLYQYNRRSDSFTEIPKLNGNLIRDIKEDSDGNIYVATAINGLFCFNRAENRWRNYFHDEKNANSLPQNNILSLFIDSKKNIWLTTQGAGFCLFDPQTESFTSYNSFNGLPNDVVYQIIEDEKGRFWISTNNGLSHFDTKTLQFTNYTVSDGLPTQQFNYSSALKATDGTLYFGTINGFIAFNPNSLKKNGRMPPLVLTDFLLFNKKVIVSEPKSPLKKSITFSDRITLSYKQNSFSFKFAVLGYESPGLDRYVYKLEGFDEEWYRVNESHLVNFSNLRHGNYVFRLKAYNPDNPRKEKIVSLQIRILPPWWLSPWAYILYVILLAGVLYLIYNQVRRRHKRRMKRQMERFEQEKEREIYTAKIDFFTEVAHEIRTPLTLIKSPLENVIGKKNLPEEIKEDLDIVNRNTNHLLGLTNQLLDFRKMERAGFQLNFRECNVSSLIKETALRFKPSIKLNHLEFREELPEKDFYASLDKEAVTKIISNLFANAIKNAATYLSVSLLSESIKGNGYFDILVGNDGTIVPDEQKEEIFKPFVQYKHSGTIKQGTGLGLSLSRAFAELHQGFLTMDKISTCNRFRLSLPIIQEYSLHLTQESPEEKEVAPESEKEDEKRKPIVLIVEDDKELSSYLTKFLTPYYSLILAFDGEKALRVLGKQYVNLVLSDVMMPNMDGFELCKKIKSDINYSHIPIVLLTAKTGLQAQIEGMEIGADAYIEKPFSNELLLATLSNLLVNKEKIIESLRNSPLLLTDPAVISKAEDDFMRKVNEIIRKNIQNPDFSQEDFAETLNMSRSSLYRKIKGVFGVSPNDFIRIRRLRKAAELLLAKNNQVTEICYLVGFNSPSYFTKCFLKEFGVYPKDYNETYLKNKSRNPSEPEDEE
ncbi:hybrid sensor histidine kinase/response regulator transcription factor [Parabacteroides sp. Marseille-P3160]|uniref:hybrid sensor histidine kinase/response regulator transcription factor n=1 Tax=Parabacteroides sp. Marseille-P3160 TaxID=1917887 RepID=UPI001F195872|nr:hybrid sensor histidine kinase/response regulator transcription factor [Parabacteroides sp. Marseille-P3160]